jgi:tRNA (guanine-N7-)-methyltransferase
MLSEIIPPGDREEMRRYFHRLFGNRNPLAVEIGSGNGHFLVEYAQSHPDRNFIGTELLAGRARKFQSKIDKRSLRNVVVFKGDARRFVWEFLYEETVEEFILLFPDPWPKKRHHKHRILSSAFIRMLEKRLLPGGTVSVATDFPEYRDRILEEFAKNSGFLDPGGTGYGGYPEEYPTSLFQERFRREGRDIFFIRFRKAGGRMNRG